MQTWTLSFQEYVIFMIIQLRFSVPLACALVLSLASFARPEPIRNSQDPNDVPTSPEESLKRMQVLDGFEVSLFAAEPDVRQPIAFDIDDRGRLWVAECYSYEKGTFDVPYDDRIIILEDVDGDGTMDRRTLFWSGPGPLTGITLGFDGVWVLCGGELRLIPDKDQNDVPDGEPTILLDGWNVRQTRHNVVNGLRWGPDGWLYGRHGITNTSLVGSPGCADDQRVFVHCCIWRFHPTKHTFEVVCNGTTNPWGFDYDDHGQMFFTNNVNGHLWHVVPGAHFLRMYGEDPNPFVYELMSKCADHDHWDSSAASWQDSREGTGTHGPLGGGHSHCGGMIYLGDNWPAQYRNTIFMCNTHGHRVNNDRLVQTGSGYVGQHQPDFLMSNSSWFRGIELKYGPDGGVFLTDWTDEGECHDHDGVHRTSGRIFKITYGQPVRSGEPVDVGMLSNAELVALQEHANDWFVRHARRVLQERAARGDDMTQATESLHQMFAESPDTTRKLRAMWALACIGSADSGWLMDQLSHPSEHVRVWAIRLLLDDGTVPDQAIEEFATMAAHDESGLVRLTLASALQRLPLGQRWEIARALDHRVEDRDDEDLTLMIWYGIEPAVPVDRDRAVRSLSEFQRPVLQRLVSRRLTEDIDLHSPAVEQLVDLLVSRNDPEFRWQVLNGMSQALQGRFKVTAPSNWSNAQRLSADGITPNLSGKITELSAVFGDGRTLDDLQKIAADPDYDPRARREALTALLRDGTRSLLPLLRELSADRGTQALAIQGLAQYSDPETIRGLLPKFVWLDAGTRQSLLETACSRQVYALELLQAAKRGTVPKHEITAYHVRQIQNLGDAQIDALLGEVWGAIRETPAEKRELISRYKSVLTPERIHKANRVEGRVLYEKTCAKCHVLFGTGGNIGPELTGSNRANADYLLENIIDPSALIPKGFEMSVVLLNDGRVLTGTITRQTQETLTLQTQDRSIVLDRRLIEELKPSRDSLMPDGQIKELTEQQIVDLAAYLMGTTQVSLPENPSGREPAPVDDDPS